MFNLFALESCAKEYTTPALGMYNTVGIMTLMCVTVKIATSVVSVQTGLGLVIPTSFIIPAIVTSVKTDAISKIVMQYIITQLGHSMGTDPRER